MVTVNCRCGQVSVEAFGAPFAAVVCHCSDCREGSRQIESLPNSISIREPGGGTAYLAYRKDRVTYVRGQALLKGFKLREGSPTNRVVATCCNCAMLLSFDDGKHWVDLYRARCSGDVPPIQMHICTKFKLEDETIPVGVRQHPHYPPSLLMKLVLARVAMALQR